MKNKGCVSQGCSGILWILVYLFIFVLAISGLGFYGLSIGIIGAVLAYTSPAYRKWLANQRGFQNRLSKLPGMASSSPTTLALSTLAYTVPLSLISWSFLLGSFGKTDTTITAAIMGLVGLVLLFGWFIQGWGIKSAVTTQPTNIIEDKSDNSKLSQDGVINYFRQNPIASIAIPIALIVPLCCCLVGTWVSPIVITPTPTATPITPTPTKLPPTATLIPSETPIPQATSTLAETVTFTPESTSTFAPTNTASASDFTVLVLTSPVRAGSNATVRIQTVAGASCYLSYTTPSGTDSQAAGLGATTAGANGVCSWTWNISPKTNAGTGSLAISANGSTQFLSIVIQ